MTTSITLHMKPVPTNVGRALLRYITAGCLSRQTLRLAQSGCYILPASPMTADAVQNLSSARGKESAYILNLRLHALRRGTARHAPQRDAVFQ